MFLLSDRKVLRVISTYIPDSAISRRSVLRQELGFSKDSLELLRTDLEGAFNVSVPSDLFASWITVGDVQRGITRLGKEKASNA